MAKLRSGILGQMRGKVAGVVGGQWKNVSYIREYVLPANPNTALQQAQRSKMADVVAFAKPLVGPIFNAYTDRFLKGMSGFNYFIKQNIAEFDGSPTYANIVITEGKLSPIITTSAVYVSGSGQMQVTWSTNYGNNGEATDQCYGAAYHVPTGVWYAAPLEVDRSTLNHLYFLPTGLSAMDFEVYTFAAKYQNTLVSMLSNSDHVQGTEP
jgi:hypothetical protein